jgi:hypothetical protein
MRPSASLPPEDSLDRAAAELRRSGNGVIAVVQDQALVGIVTEGSLAQALAQDVSPRDSLMAEVVEPSTIPPYATAAQALRIFAAGDVTALMVVDDHRRLMGMVSPSDLYPRRRIPPRPPMVGGMATPFGVYLTNGTVAGGATGLALVATGMLMFSLLTGAQLIALPLVSWLEDLRQPMWLLTVTANILPIILFLTAMRLIPLSGTHAAEHQVVHAIERGEELVPDVVRRMPRVHPRCGTNLAVGAMLFTAIFDWGFTDNTMLRLLAAVLVTAIFWRRIGSLFQLFVTTKPASDKQIRSGIRAGQELLERYATSRVSVPSVPLRIVRSGMLHVMAGSFLCYGVVVLIAEIMARFFNVRLPL